EELDRARAKLLLDWEQTYSDPQRVGVALSEAIAAGDWRLFFLRRDRIRDLKLEDTQRVAEQWLLRSNRTEGRYIPTESPVRAPEPKVIDLEPVLKDYRGDPGFTEVESFDPSPANIDERTELRTLELPNGSVSMALLPKQTRGDRVHARLQLQFGDVESLRGQRAIAETVADLLDRGTTKLSRQQIQDRFDQLEASVSFGGAGTDVLASMSTTRENLPELVALVIDILRNPTFPADQVEEYRRAVITGIHDAMNDPTQIAVRTLARHDNPWQRDDVRYVPSFEEELEEAKALQREALQAFHEWFYGAGRIHFTAVGDFDPNAVQKALADGLAGWQQAPAWQRIPTPYRDVPPKDFVIETPDKANAFYLARLPLQVQDTDPDFAALYLANSLLGQSETSRLWTRIREKEGLSYDVRSMLSISSFEPSASWSAYAIYAPSNRKQVEAAVEEELNRVVKQGFTEQEVSQGVTALLNQRRLTRAQDSVLASTWLNYLETGRTFAWSADIDRQLKALTADDLNAVVRKYLQPKRFSSAVAGDFKK
nr:insulinase family protein [Pseudomonas sp.]